jgi:hypothetical protein
MGRADKPLTACAIALVLLAGASGAVAAADPDDPATSESTSVGDSGSGGDQSADQADHTDPHPYASADTDRTAETQSGEVGPDDTGGAQESGDEQGSEKKPADDDSGSDNDRDKTINRIPVWIPEAPPVVDLGPIPEELPPLPLEPMPPVDLPPALPATPIEPDVVDVTTVGASAARPNGNEPPVLTVPVIVAPVLAPPLHILGASVAAPGTTGVRTVTSTSRWAGPPAPSIRQATTSEPLLREPPPSNVGLTARGQPSNRPGYKNADLRRGRLAEMAAGALPGVAGMVIMTASGICIGYRQAMAAQQLQPQGADRFLA